MITNNDTIDAHSNLHTFEIDPTEKVKAMEKRIARLLKADGIDALDDLVEDMDYTSLARCIVLAQARRTAHRLGLIADADSDAWWDACQEFAISCEVPNEFEERRLRAALGL